MKRIIWRRPAGDYPPVRHSSQSGFLQSRDREAIYRGGLGAGKTKVLSFWAGPRAYNGRRIILTEPTYPMVRDVLAPTLEETLGQLGLPYSVNRSTWDYFVGGGLIHLRSGERPDALRGINADDAGMDEGSYQKEAVYHQLIARTRNTEDAELRVVGTPNGRDWVYRLHQAGVRTFVQSTFKNPFLPKSYKRHLVLRYTSEMIRQELNGEIIDTSNGILRAAWFKKMGAAPFTPALRVRSWDLAVTEKTHGDYTSGVLLETDLERYHLADIQRFRNEWPDVRARIVQTAYRDGPAVPIVVEAAGMQKALVAELRGAAELAAFQVTGITPVGSKFNRLLAWTPRAEQGLVSVNSQDANLDAFFEEADNFTADDSHANDDMLDAVSQAFVYVLENPAATGGRVLDLYS